MCIYPMNSPGGYQLVGRTLPIWNTFGRAGPFSADKPWLLEFFDQVGALSGSGTAGLACGLVLGWPLHAVLASGAGCQHSKSCIAAA